MAEKALVTGGGGFLGRHIVRQLVARGDVVRVLGRHRYPSLEALGVECQLGQIDDEEAVRRACRGVDVVFHAAAIAGVWGDPEVYRRTNVVGTERVIAACRAEGVGRLVHTSSPSVVASQDGREHEGPDESCPIPERFPGEYPRTKAAAERLVLAAHGPDLATVALRPHLLIGPGDPHLVPRLLQGAIQGRLAVVGPGTNKVDLTAVENGARAHLQAASALAGGKAGGKAYFLSNGEPVVLWTWVQEFLQALGFPPLVRKVSLSRARKAATAFETTWRVLGRPGEPPLTRFAAIQMATSHWFDISAARRDLGYDPERLPMAEATARLIAWWREGPGRWELLRMRTAS